MASVLGGNDVFRDAPLPCRRTPGYGSVSSSAFMFTLNILFLKEVVSPIQRIGFHAARWRLQLVLDLGCSRAHRWPRLPKRIADM